MHQKTPKIDFFVIFRNLEKKVPICKKKYAKILNSVRAVVTDVEKNVESNNRIFFTSAKVAPNCKLNLVRNTKNTFFVVTQLYPMFYTFYFQQECKGSFIYNRTIPPLIFVKIRHEGGYS